MRGGGNRKKYTYVFDSREMIFLVAGLILIVAFSFLLGMVIGRSKAGEEFSEKLAQVTQSAQSQVEKEVQKGEASSASEPGATAPLEVKEEDLTFYSTLTDSGVKAPAAAGDLEKEIALGEEEKAGGDVSSKRKAVAAAEPGREAGGGEATGGTAPVEKRRLPTMSLGEGVYTVQVSSFRDKEQAQSLSRRLGDKGYPAYVVSTYLDKSGFWYRVRVGSFKTKDDAAKAGRVISREEGLPAMVVLRSE